MKSFKMTLAVATMATFLTATIAQAADFESQTNGAWEASATWGHTGNPAVPGVDFPTEGNTALISAGDTVHVTSFLAQADQLEVESSGVLELRDGAELEVESLLTIDGSFQFNDQTEGTRPILRAPLGALTINGNIQTVSGADDGGIIEALTGSDSIYLNSGTISSQYAPVEISAPFRNDGLCLANGGTAGFDMTFTGVISNSSVGTFEVTAANSKMIFNHDVTGGTPSLSGDADFHLSAGEMNFVQSLSTAGGVKMDSVTGSTPKIQVSAGKTFSATGTY